jgi:chromosome segregation ATPase
VSKNSALKPQYERIINRNNVKQKFAVTKALLLSSRYENCRVRLAKARTDLKHSLASHEQLQSELAPYEELLSNMRQSLDKLKKSTMSESKKLELLVERINRNSRDIRQRTIETEEFANKKDDLEKERIRLIQKLESFESEITTLQERIRTTTISKAVEVEIREINTQLSQSAEEIKTYRNRLEAVESDLMSVRHMQQANKQELDKVEDQIANNSRSGDERFQLLRKVERDSAAVFEWIQANMKKFQGKVHGPLIMELEVRDISMASYVESVIGNLLFRTFIVENASDFDLMCRQFIDPGSPMKSNISVYEHTLREVQYDLAPDQIRALGFQGVISDLLSGSDFVINFLQTTQNCSRIPYARDEVRHSLIEGSGKVLRYLASNTSFVLRSHPSNPRDFVTTTSAISPSKYLNTQFRDFSGVLKDLQDSRQNLAKEVENLDGKLRKCQVDKRKCEEELSQKQNARDTLRRRKEELGQSIQVLQRLKQELSLKRAAKEKMAGDPQKIQREMDMLEVELARSIDHKTVLAKSLLVGFTSLTPHCNFTLEWHSNGA